MNVTFIISLDESRGYTGFRSVEPPPQKFPCVRDNSVLFFSNLIHMLIMAKEDRYFKVNLSKGL